MATADDNDAAAAKDAAGSDVITPFDRCFHASIRFEDFPALGAALMAPGADLNKIYRKKTPLILAIQVFLLILLFLLLLSLLLLLLLLSSIGTSKYIVTYENVACEVCK